MNQQQLEQWIAQNGGPEGVQFATKTINVKNPAKSVTLDDGTDNPNYDPTAPATISVQVLAWTNPKTGATIAVRPNGQDAYEVVEQSGAKPATTGEAAKPPQEKDENGRRYIWEPNANGQGGQWKDVGPAAAGTKPLSPIVSTRTEKDEGTGRTVTVNVHQDGTETRAESTVTKDPNAPKPASPIVSRRTEKNEQTGQTVTVNVHADGTETRDETQVIEKPEKPTVRDIDGVPHELVQTPDGPVYKPVKIEGQGPVPDLGALNLQYGQVADGLHQRHRQYQDAIRAGTMTVAQADAAWKRDLEIGQVKVNELNSLLSTQASGFNQQVQQRGQTMSDVESRRKLGSGAMTNAMSGVFSLGETVRPGSISGADGIAAMRALADMQMQYAGKAGGMREVPEIPVPPAMGQAMKLTLAPGVSLEMPAGLQGLSGLQQQLSGGAAPAAALPAAPAAPDPTAVPQPAMPPAPTAQVTPMSIAQSLLAEDDDEDWQYGVRKAMSLLG